MDAAVNDLAISIGLLIRRMRAASPNDMQDLTWTQKSVIQRLEQNGPATTADLARAEAVTPQSMGTAIAGLEGLGLIRRKAHATDGRQLMIELTVEGSAKRKIARAARRTWLSAAISNLEKSEQTQLFRAADLLKRLAEL